jgi:hypothetical protein
VLDALYSLRMRARDPDLLGDEALPAMVVSVEALLGDPGSWDTPGGYDSVGLAMIDAIWSIGVRYQSVQNVIARYRAERLADGHRADADGPREVRRFIEASGGPEGFALRIRNHQRTSSRNGILKAEAVLREARLLEREGVAVPADLAGAGEERLQDLQARWSTVPGQASGISWRAFCMLVGLAEVKPDRMIRRYVAAAIGRAGEAAVGVEEARELVMATAAHVGVSPRALDYAIWAYQSARGPNRP